MWESQHVITRRHLEIQCKEDRGLQCVLTEQGNQVLQVLVAGFGDGEGDTEQKKAARFLEDIAILYAQDKISKYHQGSSAGKRRQARTTMPQQSAANLERQRQSGSHAYAQT